MALYALNATMQAAEVVVKAANVAVAAKGFLILNGLQHILKNIIK